MVEFDASKVYESLLKETGMSEKDANKITELTVRRIISSGIKFLSGPHIREIVCSVLSEQHHEQERKLYTRIGMPLMDYEAVLKESSQALNPEKIHHWAANQLAVEYALLRVLDDDEAQAHLYGDIHIHQLKYFDLRPLSQLWDPRIILKNGIPPGVGWSHCSKSGPAGMLRVAVNHLAKWLGMTQGEFCGQQGYNFINTFLAPYARGLNEEEIMQGMQTLVYEINQLSAIIGRDVPVTRITCAPEVLKELKDMPAIGPYGKVMGTYGDYQEECLKLFTALNKIYLEGDFQNRPFEFPHHFIYFKEEWLEKHETAYDPVWIETEVMKTPYIVNLNADWVESKVTQEIKDKYFLNHGTLQSICLNLPRYTYTSKDEDEFYQVLEDNLNMSAGILRKKQDIIRKCMETNHLPICASKLEDNLLFNIDEQELSITFAGLNEAVKVLSGQELHEDSSAFELGKKIIRKIHQTCVDLSQKYNKKFILHETNSKRARFRFAKLDLKHFPNKAKPNVEADIAFYSQSAHFRDFIQYDPVELIEKQAQLQELIKSNACERISMASLKQSSMTTKQFIHDVCNRSNIGVIKFDP